VRLSDVADVRLAASPSVIRRENISRRIEVLATVDGRDRAAVVADIEAAIGGIPFGREYHPEVVDLAASSGIAGPVGVAALTALIGMLLVLQAAFASWRLAALFLVVLTLSAAGGLVAILLGGGVVSIGSLAGLLAVFAVAARNGLSLVMHLREREARTLVRGAEFVVRGARERFVATLTTALVTAATLVPLILFGERAGLELLRPMAVAVLGGLLTATLANLFVVPVLYGRFRGSPEAEAADAPMALGEPQVAGAS
jgi:Cu/Ag efflux pump CusA